VPPGAAGDVDVVLASWWKPLWGLADNVLPLAFGQINNRTDAAMAVLLERIVSGHFGHLPTRGPEAAMVLGLDPEVLRGDPGLFAPVLDRLEGGTPTDAKAALLRTTLTDMGSRPFRKMKDAEEAGRIELLWALGRRLGTAHLIPGMTIHQAKGREWADVGVYLLPGEEHHLAAGLSREQPSDRGLYVALTRAKRSVCLV
jgi:DNA helicase II / ATP-dependent DNA helicase PcrA